MQQAHSGTPTVPCIMYDNGEIMMEDALAQKLTAGILVKVICCLLWSHLVPCLYTTDELRSLQYANECPVTLNRLCNY